MIKKKLCKHWDNHRKNLTKKKTLYPDFDTLTSNHKVSTIIIIIQ